MTIKLFHFALLATLAVGAVAATTAPAVAQSGATGALNSYLSHFELGDRNDHDLTWRSVHPAGPVSMDPFRSPDWATRGEPGSQDQGFNANFSEPQEKDDDHPCHC